MMAPTKTATTTTTPFSPLFCLLCRCLASLFLGFVAVFPSPSGFAFTTHSWCCSPPHICIHTYIHDALSSHPLIMPLSLLLHNTTSGNRRHRICGCAQHVPPPPPFLPFCVLRHNIISPSDHTIVHTYMHACMCCMCTQEEREAERQREREREHKQTQSTMQRISCGTGRGHTGREHNRETAERTPQQWW